MTAKEKFELKLKELKIIKHGTIGYDDYFECVDPVGIFYILMHYRKSDEYKIHYFGCKEDEVYEDPKFLQFVGKEYIDVDWKFKQFLDWYKGTRKEKFCFYTREKLSASKVVVDFKND